MLRKRRAYFHTNLESEANLCIQTVPLAVNAVGIEYFYRPFKAQSYRYDYSLVYVTEGSMDFWLDGKHIPAQKGSFIIISPEIHGNYGTKCENLNYFWMQFTGSNAKQLISKMKLECNTIYQIGIYEEIRDYFMKMAGEFTLNDAFFSDTSVAILMQILALLSRKVNFTDKRFWRSAEYIEAHYNEKISIDCLASIEGISSSHYRALFKKRFNTSPNEYIIMKRINSACFYLRYGKHSIEHIAGLVGYDDPFYFSRVFKKKTGKSPMQYRNEL